MAPFMLAVTEEDLRTGGGGLAAPGGRLSTALPAQVFTSTPSKPQHNNIYKSPQPNTAALTNTRQALIKGQQEQSCCLIHFTSLPA